MSGKQEVIEGLQSDGGGGLESRAVEMPAQCPVPALC